MLPSIISIFVSSTWLDLQPERHAVEAVIHRMSGAKFIGMEYFGSRPETTERASLDEVDKSDLYIGVIGGRYGSGITEAEYRRALERGLPCFIYFKNEAVIATEWREPDARLEAFKQELRARHIIAEPFSTPEQLATCVMADLHRWFFDKYLSGRLSNATANATANAAANAAAGSVITGSDDRRIRLDAGLEYGGVIHQGEAPQIRRRPTPVRPSLRPIRGLLDRFDETSAAKASLESSLPVEFFGQSGIGKTALLRHLAHHLPGERFSDGAVYLGPVGRRPPSDLLQFIFDSLYESDPGFKPRDAELLNLLRDRRALILMDDVEIGRDEVELVMNAAPGSAFLLASEERRLFGEGFVMSLSGLPADDARRLLERELGRAITAEEETAARTICSILRGHPLRLAQTAALAQGQNLTLEKIAEQLQTIEAQSSDPGEAVVRYSLASLSDGEKRALAASAAFGGALAPARALAEIADVTDIEKALKTLVSRGLLESQGAGYRLPAGAQNMLEGAWDLAPWRERALSYFTVRADEIRRDPQQRREFSAAILSLLDWASRTGRRREAIRLGVASDATLTLSGQWEAWGQALDQIGQAAEAIGDADIEAWTLHQQGTRALCLGDDDAGRRLLTDALERRIELGDHTAASVTRRNLDWLLTRVVPQQDQPPLNNEMRVDLGKPLLQRLPALAKLVIVVSLLGGSAWGVKKIVDTRASGPGPTIRFDPGRLDFGEQRLGAPGEARIVKVTNIDSQPLMISNAAISGDAPGDFRIVDNACEGATLAPQEGCSVSLVFSPQADGTRGAMLTITAGERSDLPSLRLIGAVAPTTASGPNIDPVAQILLNPLNLDFNIREVGAREERSISIANTGSAPLKINRINITGPDAGDFLVRTDTCARRSVAPGSNCAIRVQFSPRAAKSSDATLVITHDGPDGRSSAPLSGAGAAPVVNLSTTELTFGEVETGTTGKPQSVAVNNTGNAPLVISNLSIRGRGEFAVTRTNCVNATLNPNGVCMIEIGFAPRETGVFNQSLLIIGNAPDSPHSVRLSGNGIRRRLPSPSIIFFNADRSQVEPRGRVSLCYGVANATTAAIDPEIGRVRTLEKECVFAYPSQTTTYTLTAANADGQAPAKSVTIKVSAPPKPAVISAFDSSPDTIKPGGRVNLCYSVVNAVSARIEPLIGDVKPAEKNCVQASPDRSTTFSLYATGPDGQQVTRRVRVTVISVQPPPSIREFSASRASIMRGQETELCYSVLNAARAQIEPTPGNVRPSEKNCVRIRPGRTSTYTLTVTGYDGRTASASVTVQVAIAERPRILQFNANPNRIASGARTTICYGVDQADQARIDPLVGEVKPVTQNCFPIALKETTTFVLTATNGAGGVARARLTIQAQRPK